MFPLLILSKERPDTARHLAYQLVEHADWLWMTSSGRPSGRNINPNSTGSSSSPTFSASRTYRL